MPVNKLRGPGSTPLRRKFWDDVAATVDSLKKLPGKHVAVTEYKGYGSVIDIPDQRAAAPTVDCTSCDDLQPTNPSGVPVHINITRTLSGTCGTGTLTGTVEYDLDLGFGPEGPVAGHFFCAHNIFDNGFGAFWTGHFFCNGSPIWEHGDGSTQGFDGLLGRDFDDCSWWFELDAFGAGLNCGGCTLTFASIFEMISGAGDPSGVFNFTESVSGVTLATVVTIT